MVRAGELRPQAPQAPDEVFSQSSDVRPGNKLKILRLGAVPVQEKLLCTWLLLAAHYVCNIS